MTASDSTVPPDAIELFRSCSCARQARCNVQIRRPRVRAGGAEVALPTFQAFADTDPLNRRVVEQMLIGVARSVVRHVISSPDLKSRLG